MPKLDQSFVPRRGKTSSQRGKSQRSGFDPRASTFGHLEPLCLQLEKSSFELAAARNQVKEMSAGNAKLRAQLKQASAATPAPPPSPAEGASQQGLEAERRRILELEGEVARQEERWRTSEAALAELRATSAGLREARDSLQVILLPSSQIGTRTWCFCGFRGCEYGVAQTSSAVESCSQKSTWKTAI